MQADQQDLAAPGEEPCGEEPLFDCEPLADPPSTFYEDENGPGSPVAGSPTVECLDLPVAEPVAATESPLVITPDSKPV